MFRQAKGHQRLPENHRKPWETDGTGSSLQPLQETNLLTCWSRVSSLQKCEIYFCCLNYSVCVTLILCRKKNKNPSVQFNKRRKTKQSLFKVRFCDEAGLNCKVASSSVWQNMGCEGPPRMRTLDRWSGVIYTAPCHRVCILF